MRLMTVAAPIAETQLGLVAHRQLVRAGVSESTIHGAVRSGRLRRVERGVFAVPGVALEPNVRLLARVLSAGDGAVVSHRTAAWKWGLQEAAPRRPDISVPRDRRPRTRGVVVHQSSDLDLIVAGCVDGIPVTDVGRTILDCAAVPGVDVELLIDEARRRHRISRLLLPLVIARHARSGRPGINRLRRLVELDEMPHSDFERLVARWLDDCGIDGWTLHHRVVLDGFGPCEPDIAWPELALALELEGGDHRDRSAVHDRDTERQNALVAAGWEILRLTYRRWIRQTEQVRGEVDSAVRRRRNGRR